MRTGRLGAALIWLALCAAHPAVEFVPTASHLAASTEEYRRIWSTDGARIVAAMEQIVGVAYPESAIEVLVSEGRPMTSFDGKTIRLRATYSRTYKKATLVHEIGHRLAFTLRRPPDLDDHQLLYLFLYDVWADLYGAPFADRMVSIERKIGPAYAQAWDFALGLTREQRQALLRSFRPA